jgi:aryl-alcohol dehydrogenase-like predicted oxidoreductase
MENATPKPEDNSTRRSFLQKLGEGAVVGGVACSLGPSGKLAAAATGTGKVAHRTLGRTGLDVSEIGFGGHSWSYKRVPTGDGSMRKVTVDEAVEMIRAGLDAGVNFFDSCTPLDESSTPGTALKRLKARDQAIISIRVSHKMKGVKNDQQEIIKWTDERLRLWQTDYVDLCLLCNTENDTPQSGYWDMSYSIETLEKLKQQGKIRYTGFGCHFTPELFLKAIDMFGDAFDICSIPYNIRHRAAETVLPAAKAKQMGVITIKPFARGSLLKKKDLQGADAGLARDMIAFVLKNKQVDICTCGAHTLAQLRENLSASWTGLSAEAKERLGLAASVRCEGDDHAWLEQGWLYA